MPNYHPILIVDDDPRLRFTLSVILKRAGYAISAAPGAKDALRLLRSYPFSLVILDLMMPDMDGLTLLSSLHRCYPKLPVMILTGDDSNDATMQALRLGARGVLLKPVNPPQILCCVEEILRCSRFSQKQVSVKNRDLV